MPALGLLADVNIEGHVTRVLARCGAEPWRELWEWLGIRVATFDGLGLPRDISDRALWTVCQESDVVLITGNRNRHGPDSLETTIRTLNTLQSFPVVTLANPNRLLRDPQYADRVAEKLIDTFFDIEKLRGAGRVYIP